MEPLTITCQTLLKTPVEERLCMEEVVREGPYTVYLNEEPVGASLLLPTGLEEFGVGFLFSRGYLSKPQEVKEVRLCHEHKGIFVYAEVEKVVRKEGIITAECGGTGEIPQNFWERPFAPVAEYRLCLSEIRHFMAELEKASNLHSRAHGGAYLRFLV